MGCVCVCVCGFNAFTVAVSYLKVYLSEQKPVGDGFTHHEGGDQMLDGTRLAAVRSEHKRVQPSVLQTGTDIESDNGPGGTPRVRKKNNVSLKGNLSSLISEPQKTP